jgi:Holliday junction resolvase RusA-like endonuclease
MTTFIIPGNTPSSKNGRVWTGRYSIASAATRKWKLATDEHWKAQAKQFRKESKDLGKPLYIEFKFYRKSRHKFDLINIAQAVQDAMVNYDWIDDDNADELVPVFATYEYDNKNPRVEIKILKKWK